MRFRNPPADTSIEARIRIGQSSLTLGPPRRRNRAGGIRLGTNIGQSPSSVRSMALHCPSRCVLASGCIFPASLEICPPENEPLIDSAVWPYYWRMATITVKSTFSLDIESARRLESLARHWNTSKSAALRRAIRSASIQARTGNNAALESLDRLQHLLALDRGAADEWEDRVTQERRARPAPT